MGSSNSTPRPIVLSGETPVRFSSSLVETLQSSSETDHTREKALELHIQERVASELRRLEARESEILASVDRKLDKQIASEDGLNREKVQREIDALKARLENVPKVLELEEGVKNARENVVSCLRANSTRPLDCWKEVAEFKEQTRRLEKAFVVKTVGREY
ncbi:hypothetical protein FPQ18DRAFT_317997 [Pyronema domesticum]|uniref:Similar to Probable altered inheritance of mitochondria protein 13, mitochondrial acc. no. Q5ASP0 n=1 Tax=Pyronema omphalodes (strain CBS 100304) TaxID=1076935 RepID=U4LDC1_PYROM|nr:hypothetical protein FPQ18DRAFT_317997 [Pyronema domesticum]CCX08600.1 Similar to Probable altered inheritance of mitochondria protein 13, mitochondrial; acc. no. Q5ASP0 [Pyronema omphalodes CBS 100304]